MGEPTYYDVVFKLEGFQSPDKATNKALTGNPAMDTMLRDAFASRLKAMLPEGTLLNDSEIFFTKDPIVPTGSILRDKHGFTLKIPALLLTGKDRLKGVQDSAFNQARIYLTPRRNAPLASEAAPTQAAPTQAAPAAPVDAAPAPDRYAAENEVWDTMTKTEFLKYLPTIATGPYATKEQTELYQRALTFAKAPERKWLKKDGGRKTRRRKRRHSRSSLRKSSRR